MVYRRGSKKENNFAEACMYQTDTKSISSQYLDTWKLLVHRGKAHFSP